MDFLTRSRLAYLQFTVSKFLWSVFIIFQSTSYHDASVGVWDHFLIDWTGCKSFEWYGCAAYSQMVMLILTSVHPDLKLRCLHRWWFSMLLYFVRYLNWYCSKYLIEIFCRLLSRDILFPSTRRENLCLEQWSIHVHNLPLPLDQRVWIEWVVIGKN